MIDYSTFCRLRELADQKHLNAAQIAAELGLDPKTAAPLANLGFCIRNAVAVNSGKMPLDKLGDM